MLIKLPLHRKEVEEELVKMKEAVTASEEIISSVVPSVVLNNTDLPTMNLQVIITLNLDFRQDFPYFLLKLCKTYVTLLLQSHAALFSMPFLAL